MEDIRILIREGQWTELREAVKMRPPPEIADLLAELTRVDRLLLFRLLSRESAAEVFSYLDSEVQTSLLTALTDEETRQLLRNLEPDDRTHLLENLPGRAIQRMLNLLSPEDRREATQLLGYPAESVGRLMSPEYVAVRAAWTVERALRHIRSQGKSPQVIDVIYVIDEAWKLIDMLELACFVLADPASSVEQMMDRVFVTLSPHDDRERAVQMMLKYDAVALPVVDSEGVLLGVVTVDDVLDVAEEEATEDFQKSAAVTPLRVPYPEAGIWPLFLKRIPWLIGLVFVYIGASGFIAGYESILAAQIVLASFMPMLLGSAGNVGAQSGTLTVRALATGELRGVLWLRTLIKEAAVGIALGLTLAVFAGGLGYLRGGPGIGLVVAAAMVLIVTAANILGMVLPYALFKAGIDPAVASNPLITSLTDLTSLVIYFTIATGLLNW